MKAKIFKGFALIIIVLLAYNSVYFEKLSSRKNGESSNKSIKIKSQEIVNEIKNLNPPEVSELSSENAETILKKHGNRLGIGTSAYVLAKIIGKIKNISDGFMVVTATNSVDYKLDRVFIFGNTIRDASKLVKMTDYKKTNEFNSLSEEINQIIREKEIPAAIQNLKIGQSVSVKFAFKMNKRDTDLSKLDLLPVEIKVQN